jgi:dTDP-4-amino-4,6-dideoxygalactose transaminase
VAAHVFGIAADVDSLLKLGLPIIEDCAQAFGGKTEDGRQVGTMGSVAIYSLQATKPLTAGSGGIIGTAKADLSERLSSIFADDFLVRSTPVTDVAAALGLSQVARDNDAIQRRRVLAASSQSATSMSYQGWRLICRCMLQIEACFSAFRCGSRAPLTA